MPTAVQLCTALMFVYGVQSVLCCKEILYSTIQMFNRPQIKLVLCKFSKLCTVCTVPCIVAYKCAAHKYYTALYKCFSVLK